MPGQPHLTYMQNNTPAMRPCFLSISNYMNILNAVTLVVMLTFFDCVPLFSEIKRAVHL